MPELDPTPREELKDALLSKDFIEDVAPLGPGLLAAKTPSESGECTVETFSRLAEDGQWHVAVYDYDPSGSKVVLMPLTEAIDES